LSTFTYNNILFLDSLTQQLPYPENISSDIIAVGGRISKEILLDAYSKGIFPWYSHPPVQWYSPFERFVLFPDSLHCSKSLLKTIKKNIFTVTVDANFKEVIEQCSFISRPSQNGTWITSDIIKHYTALHKSGYAHSVEVWSNDRLCGGLYGVAVGKIFCGESMFSLVDDASKVGFIALASMLFNAGYKLIDCQVYTANLERFGAVTIERTDYLQMLKEYGHFVSENDWQKKYSYNSQDVLDFLHK